MLRKTLIAVAILIAVVCASPLSAQDEPEIGWSDEAEFSLVATSGNSDATTWGLKNTLHRRWENALFELKVGGLRVETTVRTGEALDTPSGPVILTQTETTAEAYFVNANYNRTISGNLFWYAGAIWERNEFAGFTNRYIAEAGVGNLWIDKETQRWFTKYAVTYTDQEDVIPNPDFDSTFVGLRARSDYLQKFGKNKNTTYENNTVVDLNLETSSAWRVDMVNSVSVTMTEQLALKAALTWLYNNMPPLEAFGLVDAAGNPIIGPGGSQVIVDLPLDELDTIFTVALVVNF